MSLYFQPRNIVLNSLAITAAGGDVTVAQGVVYLGTNRLGRYLDLTQKSWVKQTGISSQTNGVVTYTPTNPLNSTTYGFTLNQVNPSATGTMPDITTKLITITTPATGSITATTISDQFKNEFFSTGSNGFNVTVNATGAGTVVITAAAGYPFIWGSWYSGGVAGDLINTTLGIATRGLPADLIAAGVPSATASAALYTLYAGQNKEMTGFNNTMQINQPEEVFVWISESMTGYAALITRMDELMNSYAAGGTAVDPLIVENI